MSNLFESHPILATETFIVFDLETSGCSNQDRIIEVGAIKVQIQDGCFKKVDQMDCYINPGFPISGKIINLTHITNEKLQNCPTEKVPFPKIRNFFQNSAVVGQNIAFDVRFMKAMYVRQDTVFEPKDVIDLLPVSRELFPKEANHKLGHMSDLLGLSKGIHFHNALDDTTVTARLLYKYLVMQNCIQKNRR